MIDDDPGPEFEPPLLDGGARPERTPARRWPLGTGNSDPQVRRRAMWAMGIAAVLFAGGVIGLGLPSNGNGNDNVRLAASDTTVDTVAPSSGVGASTGSLNIKPVFTPIEFAAPSVQPTSTAASGATTTTVAPGTSPFAGASGTGSLAGFFVPPTTVAQPGGTTPAKSGTTTGTTTGTTRPTVPSATTTPRVTTTLAPTSPPTTHPRPPRTTTTPPPTIPTTPPPVTDPPTTVAATTIDTTPAPPTSF